MENAEILREFYGRLHREFDHLAPVIIEDYDCGQVVRHEFTLARFGRIDSYDVSADGVSLGRMGWALALVFVRKAFIRTGRFG
jgi:hypothetical protein